MDEDYEYERQRDDAYMELDDDAKLFCESLVASLYAGLSKAYDRHKDKMFWKIMGKDKLKAKLLEAIGAHMDKVDIEQIVNKLDSEV